MNYCLYIKFVPREFPNNLKVKLHLFQLCLLCFHESCPKPLDRPSL